MPDGVTGSNKIFVQDIHGHISVEDKKTEWFGRQLQKLTRFFEGKTEITPKKVNDLFEKLKNSSFHLNKIEYEKLTDIRIGLDSPTKSVQQKMTPELSALRDSIIFKHTLLKNLSKIQDSEKIETDINEFNISQITTSLRDALVDADSPLPEKRVKAEENIKIIMQFLNSKAGKKALESAEKSNNLTKLRHFMDLANKHISHKFY